MGNKKGLLKSILPWLIVLAALSVAIPFFNQSESSEIRYDKFIKIVQDEKVKEVEDAISDGSLHVFDTSTWTVNGETLDSYKKDGSDIEYISDGYFHESEYGSAPAFDIAIDGITSITE